MESTLAKLENGAGLVRELTKYATYHRSRRNIWTHFFGVPLVVFSIMVLLARANFSVAGLPVSMVWLTLVAFFVYYCILELKMGLLMLAVLVPGVLLAQPLGTLSFWPWLGVALGIFAIGWVLQFIGHFYEGRKPAFFDDLIGLAIGPVFVVSEVLFLLGFRHSLMHEIERNAGPSRP